MSAALSPAEEPDFDPIEAILDAHHGDPKAAIADLLARCQHLRAELFIASALISSSMTRGWTPSFEQA